MAAGGILGGVTGLAMSSRWARFETGGPLDKRMMRAAIGGAGGAAIYYGLQYLTPREPEVIWTLSIFLRTALALFWVLFLTPWFSLKQDSPIRSRRQSVERLEAERAEPKSIPTLHALTLYAPRLFCTNPSGHEKTSVGDSRNHLCAGNSN
jgi:hypothetical protein